MTEHSHPRPAVVPPTSDRVVPVMPPPQYKCAVLAVDDEPAILALLRQQLGYHFDVQTAASAADARTRVEQHPPDIVIADLTLPDASGVQLLDWVYHASPRTARVLISGTASLQDAVDAINRGRVHRLILKPWRAEDLVAHLREVARGVLLERSHERLLEELRSLNLDLERRVEERTRELKLMNQMLEKLALTDQLTGLPNRRSIEMIAKQELLRRARTPAPITFGLLDADWFKSINTRYLLSGGDTALVALAKTLQHTVRGTDAIGRVGGEEFLLVAPDTDLGGAEVLAERLRAEVERMQVPHNGGHIPVTVSGGFVVADAATPADFERMREVAAEALAAAKSGGRNRCVVKQFTGEPIAASA